MVRRRTVDLLPEIFRTDTNKKFLSATLDQLTQEPQFKRVSGYVGRRIGPGVNPNDNYVLEPSQVRANYQLEPGVVALRPDTDQAQDVMTYTGIIDSLGIAGGDINRQDRLFESQYYTWDPFVDLDKFTNFSQYYWLPDGPAPVDVASTAVPLTDDFEITRGLLGLEFSGTTGANPTITLARGGNYRFDVNQPGAGFFIQTTPGVAGVLPWAPNISNRSVLGVTNNGTDSGTVSFDVPLRTAQDFFYQLQDLAPVDLVWTGQFNEINNIYLDQFLQTYPQGIDGITSLSGRTVIITNSVSDAATGGWQLTETFDPLVRGSANQFSVYDANTGTSALVPPITPSSNDGREGSYDTTGFDQAQDIPFDERYVVWQINYNTDTSNRIYLTLTPVRGIPTLSKFAILFGTEYSSTQWYKDAEGFLLEVPLLTAVLDTLWYQDSADPAFFGRIKLVDSSNDNPLDIDDIIGRKNYTSPNGVTFTNGLKIKIRGDVVPASYQDREFYIEGVGTGPGEALRVGFVDGQAYFGPFHTHDGQKMTGSVHGDTFHQFIYDTVQESLDNLGRGGPEGAPLDDQGVPGAVLGTGIQLVPVERLVTPESYIQQQTAQGNNTVPLIPDYITINRAAADGNAWSRSNRWFHVDIIRAAANYNNEIVQLDNNARAKRPVLEFRANLDLFNNGTQAKPPIDIIDFRITDALGSQTQGLPVRISGLAPDQLDPIDGYRLEQGSRVIFARDIDPDVRNSIYRVDIIDPDGTGPVVSLVPTICCEALYNQTVLVTQGDTERGYMYWFDGDSWVQSQEKEGINQAPLFDVFDLQGYSFGDQTRYPSSTFRGSRLFGYALGGTQRVDDVLGFALRYLNINNVGDIVFENYLYSDTFDYVQDNIGQTLNISQGTARQYIDRVSFTQLIGWLTAATENRSRQVFRFVYDGSSLIFDVAADLTSVLAPIQLYVSGVFVDPSRYSITVSEQGTVVTLTDPPDIGTVIEAEIISNSVSQVGYYEVPPNLENNPFNENTTSTTLGVIRSHFETIGQNLRGVQGRIIGANNIRDLGNVLPYGENIIQNSAPLTLTGVFLRDQQFQIFDALKFNGQEYEKFKARLLDVAARGDFINLTTTQILDAALLEISLGRSNLSPFYWSDMIPSGEIYRTLRYTVTPISTAVFDTSRVYDFTTSNFQGLLVYLNGNILTKGYDYIVGSDSATITITVPLSVGDAVEIREYDPTYGSFVPNTPTKLGLYPKYRPAIYEDTSYVNPTLVIRGHDGSITVAYNDIRDDILLEFETRIYNNLKIDSEVPLSAAEVIPGQFRATDYSLAEVNSVLITDFLSWVGWNKIDYITQQYSGTNAFTYNYSQSSNRLDQQPLLGAWRGIYQYFYDTIAPDTAPWEMLGFSERPSWWEDTYGPAPYTSGNLVLWEDLSQGLVDDPQGDYILEQYRRPGLLSVIPTGSEGQLLPPIDSTVANYDIGSFRRSWTFGDGGPAEWAWRSSSSYPFAVMRLLALLKPAKFFSLFADRDRYRFSTQLDQFVWDQRYRLDAAQLQPLYGQGTSKASYINWIIDYNRQSGRDSTEAITERLRNLDVRLCWRMASFSDKKYLKVRTERSTPDSTNLSQLLPDESYSLLLYQNQPFSQFSYSSVIIQSTDQGWSVLGYDPVRPYFNILVSQPSGASETLSAGGSSVSVSVQYTDRVVRVPYGFVFTNRAAVCDFLLSYGQLLQRQGWTFEGIENGYIMDWLQMAQEFLYWSGQGWVPGSLINLNPGATKVSITRPDAVADSLRPERPSDIILNQNRQPMSVTSMAIDRLENTFSVTSLTSDTINFVNLRFTSFEHVMVLDNRSIFADLIYQPVTGARQSRIFVDGIVSDDWNGLVDAPGFVISQDNVRAWRRNQKYTKGEFVLFKNDYYTAATIIEPSEEFNYNAWLRVDRDELQTGMLLNSATASDELAQAYNTFDANLENEVDLFSYGLIGFRKRPYMEALGLDDVSQVNIYQQFLGTKGTKRSAEAFSLADLGKESAEYNIYEYWAMLRGGYGATANRRFFEILLDSARLQSDPNLVQVIQPQQSSVADQTVVISDLWKTSFPVTNPELLPTLVSADVETSLPSAGYVNLEDVDITVFDLGQNFPITQSLASLGVGTTIWAASVNEYDWNVYRCETINARVISFSDNLDAQALVTFNGFHSLSVGDTLIIKYFALGIDGVYRVSAVPGIFAVLVDFQFVGNQTEFLGSGLAFRLDSARTQQPSNIPALPYARDLFPGARVWVDENPQGLWSVLEKTDPFTSADPFDIAGVTASSQYGRSLSQGLQNNSALVGAPGAGISGVVYAFGPDPQGIPVEKAQLTLDITGSGGFGCALDIGDQSWSVIGANTSLSGVGVAATYFNFQGLSNRYQQRQILMPIDGSGNFDTGITGFASAVTMSQDERWIYVGAPDNNKVYAYGQVEVEQQSVTYTADGSTAAFNWTDHIVIDPAVPQQLTVILNNRVIPAYQGSLSSFQGISFDIVGDDIELIGQDGSTLYLPDAGEEITIQRTSSIELDSNFYFGVTGNTGTATFNVQVRRGIYGVSINQPGSGYTVSDTIIVTGDKVGGTTPANDITITVTAVGTGGQLEAVTSVGSGIDDEDEFDLTMLYTVENIYGFLVRVDGVQYRPFVDYTYAAGMLTFDSSSLPPAGASIQVITNSYYETVPEFIIDGAALSGVMPGDQFGFSISCTTDGRQVIISCPGQSVTVDNTAVVGAGRSYVFDRAVQRIIIAASQYQSTVSYTAGAKVLYTYQNGNNQAVTLLYQNVSASTNQPPVIDGELNSVYWSQSLTYASVKPFLGPITVLVNGNEVGAADLDIGPGYTVAGQNIVINNALVTPGDNLVIETNQFQLLGTFQSTAPTVDMQFGYTVDHCVDDCSVYIGAPYDSNFVYQGGSVEYWTNQARLYGNIISNVDDADLSGNTNQYIRVNDIYVQRPAAEIDSSWLEAMAQAITSSVPNVIARVVAQGDARFLEIAAKNPDAAPRLNKVNVLPGTGTLFQDLGFDIYVRQQYIRPPTTDEFQRFGQSLFISDNIETLIVGAPNGTMYRSMTLDASATRFDSDSTLFVDDSAGRQPESIDIPRSNGFYVPDVSALLLQAQPLRSTYQSGVVYTYDLLRSASPSVDNPNQYAFGQQIVDQRTETGDGFGSAVDYTTGVLLISAPTFDFSPALVDSGQVARFLNLNRDPAWRTVRQETPVVDINLLNTIFIYDRITGSTQTYLDYFDPLQGKLLGAVQQNLDYIGTQDPAAYNIGLVNNYGQRWLDDRVGQIWWNIGRVRFIDPYQDDPVYASRRWGQPFPGSSIDIYQWIVSSVPPAQYIGPGIPLALDRYSVVSSINEQGIFETRFYFWVSGLREVDRSAGKTLSIETIRRYIENPRSSGIAYLVPINPSTVAIYNTNQFVEALDTVLHIEFDVALNDDPVHLEYQLLAQDKPTAFLDASLYRKMVDSFAGIDQTGAPVPDPGLPISERYGVQFRPRQSFFENRFLALQNYLQQTNTVLQQFPVAENRIFNLLNSSDPIPPQNLGDNDPSRWDQAVTDLTELSYQNIYAVELGFRYLVLSDSSNNGLWTIYQVDTVQLTVERRLELVKVQTYDTRLYWRFIDWIDPTYDPATRIVTSVPNTAALETITVPDGSSVKVDANAQNKFEIYVREGSGWRRVVLQDGTIRFDDRLWDYQLGRYGFDIEVFDAQYFDQEPVIETRQIIRAINEEILTGDFLIEKNRLMILMFNYIMSEQVSPDWLTKTSLIDVEHVIRDLVPFQVYRRDNQDFVLDYIKEVKPYHVQIREFDLKYRGRDQYLGDVTDFDLPAYWDAQRNIFVSPILDNTGRVSPTSSVPSNSAIWQTFPWNQWYQNYLLQIDNIQIIDAGDGYTVAPQITIKQPISAVRLPDLQAVIDGAGRVIGIEIIDPGLGYSTTPILEISGGNGSGARAVVNMIGQGQGRDYGQGTNPQTSIKYNLARSITTTIKYDRYQYQTTILPWQQNALYFLGDRVRYDDRIWVAQVNNQSDQFETADWDIVDVATVELEFVPWDENTKQGNYYQPLELTSGVDRTMGLYVPTVRQPGLDLAQLITGVDYPGVQVKALDFEQIQELDAIYASSFLDPFLGIGATAINVEGGAFVDEFSSHAPEELIPGAVFDTMDFRVFTTPGADWSGDGHGFPIGEQVFIILSLPQSLDFLELLPYTVQVQVYNRDTGRLLLLGTDYTIDWEQGTVELTSGASPGQRVLIRASELGGGNQLYRDVYRNQDLGNSVVIPVPRNIIWSTAIFVNGTEIFATLLQAVDPSNTRIFLPVTVTAQDYMVITVLGQQQNLDEPSNWSVPLTQYFVSNGSLTYSLSNSLQGTNPANIVVSRNGLRIRPAEGKKYIIIDDSTVVFALPWAGDYDPDSVTDSEVTVYLDDTRLISGVDYELDAGDGSSAKTVTLLITPTVGSTLLISVDTASPYRISGTQLIFKVDGGVVPQAGDIFSATTFNDTQQQDLLTLVFVGPTITEQNVTVNTPYDPLTRGTADQYSTYDANTGIATLVPPPTPSPFDGTLGSYDFANVNFDAGSYDYGIGIDVLQNVFDLGRVITEADRLIVSLDGKYLFAGSGYVIENETKLVILGPAISALSVVAVTLFAQSVIPGEMAFRIFQDMRGYQRSYRITRLTSTEVTATVLPSDDEIFVLDAGRLPEPNLPNGIFGMITINGERLTYRTRDLARNSISGLRRGVAGTGAAMHTSGSMVYDIGIGNLLPVEYQDRIVQNDVIADGSTQIFVAPEITMIDDSTESAAVQVYVGGVLQEPTTYLIVSIEPVTVEFDQPPAAGLQVKIQVTMGRSWYPANMLVPIPLQEADTVAARFMRGES